jgi:CRP-like cAMP-binding protein
MSEIASLLIGSPTFQLIAPNRLSRVTEYFHQSHISAGHVVYRSGDPGGALALVVTGELVVSSGEYQVGEVRAGELVGEASAFMEGATRTATLTAVKDTVLLELSQDALFRCREEQGWFYDVLLECALKRLVRRINSADAQIARKATGTDPAPSRSTGFKSFWKKLTRSVADSPPVLSTALRMLPGLLYAPGDLLVQLGRSMTPLQVQEGEALFLEGDKGDSLYLVGQGQIVVYRHVRGGRAEKLADLHRGSLFGTGGAISGQRRNASCVAEDTTWVFEMNQEQLRALTGEPGRLWRESLVSALHFQLNGADQLLAELGGVVDAKLLARASANLTAYIAKPMEL